MRRVHLDRPIKIMLVLLLMVGSGTSYPSAPNPSLTATATEPVNQPLPEPSMWMIVGKHRFAITLADNKAAQVFASMAPLRLDMAELNGNEKFADLPKALPVNATRPGLIRNGDLMLYGSKTLVIFYLSFDSAYTYTPLGKLDDPAGLAQALGQEAVTVTFAHN